MGRLPGAAGLLNAVADGARWWDAGSTFERFTDTAREVVTDAQVESRGLRHAFIGTEHLLLGILRQGDRPAVRWLGEHGVDADTVRPRVVEIVGTGDEEVSGQMPFTPRAKKVLELAVRECLSHANERITPEHLLLGLLREGDGVAAQVLAALGLDLAAARSRIEGLLPPPGAVLREASRRVRAAGPPVPMAGELHVLPSPEVHRLLMSAAARALDDGRTEITVADLEEALRRRADPGEPPTAATA